MEDDRGEAEIGERPEMARPDRVSWYVPSSAPSSLPPWGRPASLRSPGKKIPREGRTNRSGDTSENSRGFGGSDDDAPPVVVAAGAGGAGDATWARRLARRTNWPTAEAKLKGRKKGRIKKIKSSKGRGTSRTGESVGVERVMGGSVGTRRDESDEGRACQRLEEVPREGEPGQTSPGTRYTGRR